MSVLYFLSIPEGHTCNCATNSLKQMKLAALVTALDTGTVLGECSCQRQMCVKLDLRSADEVSHGKRLSR